MSRTAKLNVSRTEIEIRFRYDVDDVVRMRKLVGWRFVGSPQNDKHWTCRLTNENADLLSSWGFSPDPTLYKWRVEGESVQPAVKELDFGPKFARMRPFQRVGASFIVSRNGRALLADDMRLGKTVQTLAALTKMPDCTPILVICPASAKLPWRREVLEWTDWRPSVLNGAKEKKSDGGRSKDCQVWIINYDILQHWLPLLNGKIKTVVLDEAHRLKNPSAKRTKAAKILCKSVGRVIALTGTPIENRPCELHSPISMINPSIFPSRWSFLQRYCDLKNNGFGWDYSGATNVAELHDILTKTVMLRRRKMDVLKELPPKQRIVVPLALNNRADYDSAVDNFNAWLDSQDKVSESVATKNELETLKRLALKGKLAAAMEWIADWLEDGSKLVVFCHHHETVHALEERFKNVSVTIYGGTSEEARQTARDQFQTNDKCRLLIGTLAAKEGIDLSAANDTAFVELWWSPGDHSQAEDRVYHVDKTGESVGAYYLVAEGTIEERIAKVLDKKQKIVEAVTDGREPDRGSLIGELLKELKEDRMKGERLFK